MLKQAKVRMTSRHNCGGHYNSQVPQAQSMLCVHGSAIFKVRLTYRQLQSDFNKKFKLLNKNKK